jgi:hypothetical protein
MSAALTDSHTFRAIAVAVVPEARGLSPEEWREFAAIVDGALAKRPARMQRQLRIFLRLLNLLSIVRHRRGLASLDVKQRTAFLHQIENSKLLLFRRGFWGVRTLVFMGYYARPGVNTALGYRANSRGWEARR